MTIARTYYGLDRRNANEINKLATRVNTIDATVPAVIFPRQFSINRWTATAIDKMAKAVATADGKDQASVFGRHFHGMSKAVVSQLIALEVRVTALGR